MAAELERELTEEWRGIAGFPQYAVSSLGRVKRTVAGQGTQMAVLRPGRAKSGYMTYALWQNNKGKSVNAHRLVAEAFLPIPEELVGLKLNVNHIDFDRANNSAANLEWVTPSQNHMHTIRAGRHLCNKGGKLHKPISDMAVEIRRLAANGTTGRECARRFGVSQSTASRIINFKRWAG